MVPRLSSRPLARRPVCLTALVCALGFSLAGPAAAGTPSFTPTAAEQAELASGRVVLRSLASQDERVRVLGIADIPSGSDPIWSALLDFKGRLGGNASLRAVDEYRTATATEQWYRWEVSRFGYTVVYHNHYRIDRAAGSLIHELDPDQPNDLRFSRGEYELYPSPDHVGWTRLTYLVESDFGRAIPGFLQEWLCGAGVRDFLEDLVKRAQTAGGAR